MPKLSLKRRIEIAGQLAVRSRAYFDTFDFYQDRKQYGQHFEGQWKKHYWFFKYEMHVYRLSFILKAAALFKSTPQWATVNFPDIVRELSPKLDPGVLKSLQADLGLAKPTATKLDIIRNNALAHRSADLDFDEAFKKAKVTRAELRSLTDISLRLANTLAAEVNVPSVAFHTQETLRDLKRVFTGLGSRFPSSGDAFEEIFGDR